MFLSNFKFCHLVQVRSYFNLTQSQLAFLLKVSKNTVSNWENGSLPSLSHFLDICSLFSLPYQFFLDYRDLNFDDVSLALDIYYASFSYFGESLYQDLYPRYPASRLVEFFSDEGNFDSFSWVCDAAIVKKIYFILERFDLIRDYSVPSRFSALFERMYWGGFHNA